MSKERCPSCSQPLLTAEQEQLCRAVDWFAGLMKDKLITQERRGYEGWRQKRFIKAKRGGCKGKLLTHVQRLMDGEPQEVDVANLCMFLAYGRHIRGEGRKLKGESERWTLKTDS